MRLAWFCPSDAESTAPLRTALALTGDLDVYTLSNAHDFVWHHFRNPYEVCVFELDNTAAHAFIWPYLVHYGGVLLLWSPTLHDSRARALLAAGRRDDYAAEFLFSEGHPPGRRQRMTAITGDWPMLRVPLTMAHATVVPCRALADALRDEYAPARIVYAPLVAEEHPRRPTPRSSSSAVVFGMLASDRVEIAGRALIRAQGLGANASLVIQPSAEQVLATADVVVTLAWSSRNQGRPSHPAFAAGIPVIALETICSADWPSLDPQTWRPRGASTDRPIAVTVDLRDEEHSLAVAMRRLAADAALRSELGEHARAWSRAHESAPVAVDAWQRLLHEAARIEPPPRPPDWPDHFTADGTGEARAILAQFGATVDLF
jgi:hypothetical protein